MLSLIDPETGHSITVFRDPNMRTLIDAVDKLEKLGGITEDSRAVIETAPLPLPSGKITHLITLVGAGTDGHVWRIALPSSNEVRASDTFGVRRLYEVSVLDGATVELAGNVNLVDGRFIHAVEFLPTLLHHHLTKLEETIIRHVIRLLKAEKPCRPYRSLETEAPFVREGVEELLKYANGLDYSVLPKLVLPPLNVIEHELAKRFPELKRQTMTLAFFKAGIPLPPRSRKRAA